MATVFLWLCFHIHYPVPISLSFVFTWLYWCFHSTMSPYHHLYIQCPVDIPKYQFFHTSATTTIILSICNFQYCTVNIILSTPYCSSTHNTITMPHPKLQLYHLRYDISIYHSIAASFWYNCTGSKFRTKAWMIVKVGERCLICFCCSLGLINLLRTTHYYLIRNFKLSPLCSINIFCQPIHSFWHTVPETVYWLTENINTT